MHLGLHPARNCLQFLTKLLGFLVIFLDFGDGGAQFGGLFDDILVGHHQVGHHQDVADGDRIAAAASRQRQDFANH